MTNTKHTPPPWRVTMHTAAYGTYTVHPFAERQQAAEGDDHLDPLGGEDEANRQLLEAAPHLLAELRWLLEAVFSTGIPEAQAQRITMAARAAIAQATGRGGQNHD